MLYGFPNYDAAKKYFKEECGLGEHSTYGGFIRIASKGTAKLLMEVHLEKMDLNGKSVIAVVVKFLLRDGLPDTFEPHLIATGAYEASVFQLQTMKFALCPEHPSISPLLSFYSQDVAPKLLNWVKDLCTILGAEPVADTVIGRVINLQIPTIDALSPPAEANLFSLDSAFKEGGSPPQDKGSNGPAPGDDLGMN